MTNVVTTDTIGHEVRLHTVRFNGNLFFSNKYISVGTVFDTRILGRGSEAAEYDFSNMQHDAAPRSFLLEPFLHQRLQYYYQLKITYAISLNQISFPFWWQTNRQGNFLGNYPPRVVKSLVMPKTGGITAGSIAPAKYHHDIMESCPNFGLSLWPLVFS